MERNISVHFGRQVAATSHFFVSFLASDDALDKYLKGG